MPARTDGQHLSTWRGGRDIRKREGYVRALNHRGHGGHVHEQVVIAERVLGHRLPPGAEVHHVNSTRADNRNDNLVILQSDADHKEIHRKMKVRAAGGDPWLHRLCNDCYRAKPTTEFYRIQHARDGLVFSSYCKPCARRQATERQRAARTA